MLPDRIELSRLGLQPSALPTELKKHGTGDRSRTYTDFTPLVSKTSAAASYATPAFKGFSLTT